MQVSMQVTEVSECLFCTTKKGGYPSILKTIGIAPKSTGIGSKFLFRRFKSPRFEYRDRVAGPLPALFRPCSSVFTCVGTAFMKM